MWPDLAEFRHFGNILKVLSDYARAYLALGNNLNLLWSTFYAIGQIFIATNGQNNFQKTDFSPKGPATRNRRSC